MGPGLITAAADNDSGGIATYATAGARYGYDMLWVLFLVTFSLAVVQEMCARMGAVTGKGLSDLIRENFGVRWTVFAMAVLLVALATTTVAEFAGIAASLELFGLSRYLTVPLAAAAVWWLVVKGSYRYVERILLLLALFLLAYVPAGIIVGPDWGAVARGLLVPSFRLEPDFILLSIAVIGTTITPWMQFFLQSTVVDKGLRAAHYEYARWDVFFGAFFTDFVAFFIILATAATLFQAGQHIETAADAARALEPLAGARAELLFALGLFGASVLAASVLPLSTAYAVCEAFGWERGIGLSFGEAPMFFGLYTALIVFGAGMVLLQQVSLMQVMLLSQEVNGLLLPVILVFMLLLVNDRRLMGRYVNGPIFNAVAWATAAVLIVLTVLLTGTTVASLVA